MSEVPEKGRNPEAAPPTQDDIEHARYFLAEVRAELSRAEGKAAILLAALGVIAGALLAALMAGNWSPFELRNSVEWVWWIGAVCLVAAAVCLAAAVWPRTSTGVPGRRRLAFFGDFASFKNARELSAALRIEDHADGLERTADQLLSVSRIVRRKYRFVKGAMLLLGLAAALCLGAALVNALLPDSPRQPSRSSSETASFCCDSPPMTDPVAGIRCGYSVYNPGSVEEQHEQGWAFNRREYQRVGEGPWRTWCRLEGNLRWL